MFGLPEHEQLGIFRPVTAEHQDGQAEYPARQQVDDLDQHPASQPPLRPPCRQTVQVTPPNRVIERHRSQDTLARRWHGMRSPARKTFRRRRLQSGDQPARNAAAFAR